MNIAATGKCDVRMKRADLRFETTLERCFLHALVKLKQMRMTSADADPDDFGRAFGWKFSKANDRKKERFKLNGAQSFAQTKLDRLRHVIEKAEREMHLPAIHAVYSANVWIKIDKRLSRRIGQIDRDKETFAHGKILRSSCTFSSIENSVHARA